MAEVAEGEEKGFGAALVAENGKFMSVSSMAVLLFSMRFRVVVRGCVERVVMGGENGGLDVGGKGFVPLKQVLVCVC